MPLPQPELPEPAHPEVESMLSRKFGKEIANYFSGTFGLFPLKWFERLIFMSQAPL